MTQLESASPARHPLPLPEAATNSKGLPLEVGKVAGTGISEQGGEGPPLHFFQPRARFLRKKKSLSTSEAQAEAVPLLRSSNQKDSSSRQLHEKFVNLWMTFISIQKARRPFWPGSASRHILCLPPKGTNSKTYAKMSQAQSCSQIRCALPAEGNLQRWVQTW